MPIRIVIADDHAIFRSGLRMLLEREADFAVVGESSSGPETLSVVGSTLPDVLILDLGLPELPGAKVAEAIVHRHPEVAIVVLTMHEDEHYLRDLLRIGAGGFVLKRSTSSDLAQAIRAVRRGERYVDPTLAGDLISHQVGRSSRTAKEGTVDVLTPREREVLTLLAHGHTSKEIAGQLGIAERTAETHRANLMGKLGIKNRAELVRLAIKVGVLSLG